MTDLPTPAAEETDGMLQAVPGSLSSGTVLHVLRHEEPSWWGGAYPEETEEERLMNMEEYDDAINEYQAGYLRTANSHTLGTDEWKAWDAGWLAAENAEPK